MRDELAPADLIHVVSGSNNRLDYAIQLYKEGYAPKLLFTSSWTPYLKKTYAQYQKEYALEHGVPARAIFLDGLSINSTYAEAERLKEFLERSEVPIHSVIVVSDPYHMRRAWWAYRRVLGEQVKVQMAPVCTFRCPLSSTAGGLIRSPARWWGRVFKDDVLLCMVSV